LSARFSLSERDGFFALSCFGDLSPMVGSSGSVVRG
jgi:hypothetical protein